MYEPIQYWKEAGKHYFQDFVYSDIFIQQEQSLVEYLKQIQFKTVLELGCGFGRITRLLDQYFHIDDYVAVDISPEQLKYAKQYPFKNIKFIESDIESLQLDKKYDLVIAVEVLMHQLPSNIQFIINKMKSLSNHHVINVDYSGKKKYLAPHNFAHDYTTLYNTRVNIIPINAQSIIHCELE